MSSSLRRAVMPFVPRVIGTLCRISSRLYSSDNQGSSDKINNNFPARSKLTDESDDSSSPIAIASKYTTFIEDDAPVILDVEEEKMLAQQASLPKDPLDDVFARISKNRGTTGVFDVHELIEVLKLSRAREVCVITVPKEAKYVDYMLIVSGKSPRHILAMAEFVRRVYKKKRLEDDAIPKIEGKTSKDWMAMDLGNIALHIFSPSARELYDLESLWALGAEFDINYNKPEESIVSLLKEHSFVLDHLHPAS